tara:strand:+ start:1006 stop:1557 length:552 start_codon:yes stop_codon:yes gene_type:complete
MSLTPSNMLPLGTIAPNFKLLDVTTNSYVSINDSVGKFGTVIMFICNHCPYVKHINSTISNIANEYIDDLSFIAISSNDIINYPDDSPEKLKKQAIDHQFNFPYLYDETQNVAKEYKAACTPDIYLFDSKLSLTYRGQLDDSRPGNNIKCNGNDLKYAIDCLIYGKINERIQKPSIGCNIKWK